MPFAEINDDGLIHVVTDWNDKELIKSIPGSAWNPHEKIWTLPLAWSSCVTLKGVFNDYLRVGDRLTQWVWTEYNTRVLPSRSLRDKYEDPDGAIHNNPALYTFQRLGVEWLIRAGSGLLGDEMGTGKTIQVLAAMDLIETSLPALVICPNSVKPHWAKEASKWLPRANPYVLIGSANVKAKMIAEAREDSNALVITNFESTWRLSRLAGYGSIRLTRCKECDPKYGWDLKPAQCEVHPRVINSIPFKTVIVDEAHRIKDPKTKQTRATWALGSGDSVVRRWGLTGTPLANDPSDLWSIMHFIAPKEYPTKTKFVERYCLQAWNMHGGLDVVGLNPQTRDEFYKFFDARFRRMPKDLVLEQLPPKIYSTRFVEMTPRQAKAYKEIESKLITRLADGTILVAKTNLSARTRLLQLASAYCKIEYDPTDPDPANCIVELCEPSTKIDELMLVLEELGDRSVVVAAEHRRLIELAAARLAKNDISHGLITGAIDQYERDETLEKFQAGKLRVLLFTVKAGGTGLTMTAASTIVFLQRSWSMIDNLQAIDRVHRIGSEIHESIHVVNIVTQDTVEVQQIERIDAKIRRLQEITRDRAALARAGKDTTAYDRYEHAIVSSDVGEVDNLTQHAINDAITMFGGTV